MSKEPLGFTFWRPVGIFRQSAGPHIAAPREFPP